MADNTSGRSHRWAALLDLLSERGRLSVTEACAELGVSEATIRRDFGLLADQQLATRTHGGVVATTVAYDLPARYRSSTPDDAKSRIAQRAADLLPAGAVVGLNGGTTTTDVAHRIASRPDLAQHETATLTVVTNALNIAGQLVLRPYLRCVSLGGIARPESYEVTGPLAASVMEQLWLDVAILGVAAFSARNGATCGHEEEAAIGRIMAERSDRVVVVATGAKIGRHAFARMIDSDDIDTLVTDDSADPEELTALQEKGTEIILA
ncbi:transcriptional regulator, DeoR family [Austwickia chelonae]|uniref:Putative DeoR family transcriptional regulator n=1 Tax=Austwickia chelonae NBRC 105200 TaxID=1184607 RepID=K6UMB5_9MICO|nr:DeoR/GlpR family DNA-binding transcription regulator [Austwickia chelonae]GAB77966.1 putative DeoR family transcriptional regulator [Austwickia chelonae NBRC 105200]SEV93248.1 transcriptional regulator, DeoR family [Austwickia chelonae]